MDRLSEDMVALGHISRRFACTEGEREMLQAVRARLPEVENRVEGLVGHPSPALSVGLHAAALGAFAAVGYFYPLVGAVFAALASLSLVGEGTGRFTLLRHLLPKLPSYNLVARHRVERPLGALILATPLDIPRWRPRWPKWLRWHRPLQAVLVAAMLSIAPLLLHSPGQPWGLRLLELYGLGLLFLTGTFVVGGLIHRYAGQEDADASGPAVALELARRLHENPPSGVEVWWVFTGCGQAHQEGMDAFLRLHARAFPETVLVLALDDPGRPPLQAAFSEGSLVAQHHRPTGPALAERLAWAGKQIPAVDLHRVTNARAALLLGYRALALAGGEGTSDPRRAADAADAAEILARWFAEDLGRMAKTRTLPPSTAR